MIRAVAAILVMVVGSSPGSPARSTSGIRCDRWGLARCPRMPCVPARAGMIHESRFTGVTRLGVDEHAWRHVSKGPHTGG